MGDKQRGEKTMIKIGIIIGSTRPGRVGESVSRWVFQIAQERKAQAPLTRSQSVCLRRSVCRDYGRLTPTAKAQLRQRLNSKFN